MSAFLENPPAPLRSPGSSGFQVFAGPAAPDPAAKNSGPGDAPGPPDGGGHPGPAIAPLRTRAAPEALPTFRPAVLVVSTTAFWSSAEYVESAIKRQ